MKNYVAAIHGRARESTVRALKELSPKVTGSKIILKPNLSSRVRNNGENTDVAVVEGVVEYFQGRGDITIAEGCCGSTSLVPNSTYELFDFAGYSELEDKYGVQLLDLNTDEFVRVELHDKVIGVAKTALDADYLITVPVLKTHVYTTISGCLKNLMGCLRPKPEAGCETSTKWDIHSELYGCDLSDLNEYVLALQKFERRLVELYKVLSPKLGVMDAIVASEGDAPIHGNPIQMDMILASENPVCCDAVAADLIGVDPNTIGLLELANKQGLGEINPDKIELSMSIQKYKKKLKLPYSVDYLKEKTNI